MSKKDIRSSREVAERLRLEVENKLLKDTIYSLTLIICNEKSKKLGDWIK